MTQSEDKCDKLSKTANMMMNKLIHMQYLLFDLTGIYMYIYIYNINIIYVYTYMKRNIQYHMK